MARVEIRLSGEGGQGIILAGIILAEAAAIYDGKNAVQTQSYGPESRGGASKAEVILDEGNIDYPEVQRPQILLAMNPEACEKYAPSLAPGGTLIVDETFVKEIPKIDGKAYSVPITGIAREAFKRDIVANIVALGTVTALTGVVSRPAIEQAVLSRVPKGTEDLNRRALEAGLAAGDEIIRRVARPSR
ncbi:MAG TPA: 2-oxoacid:acceptor oxidoreductase family protein [Bacillota bacterium]